MKFSMLHIVKFVLCICYAWKAGGKEGLRIQVEMNRILTLKNSYDPDPVQKSPPTFKRSVDLDPTYETSFIYLPQYYQ